MINSSGIPNIDYSFNHLHSIFSVSVCFTSWDFLHGLRRGTALALALALASAF